MRCRFLTFYRSLTNSGNALVRYLSNVMIFTNSSTISSNFNRILYDLNLEACELAGYSLNYVKDMYYDKWLNNVDNQYMVHSKVIKELIMMKEGFFSRVLETLQCDLVVNF